MATHQRKLVNWNELPRYAVGDPDQTGALAGARVLEQLAGAAPTKK